MAAPSVRNRERKVALCGRCLHSTLESSRQHGTATKSCGCRTDHPILGIRVFTAQLPLHSYHCTVSPAERACLCRIPVRVPCVLTVLLHLAMGRKEGDRLERKANSDVTLAFYCSPLWSKPSCRTTGLQNPVLQMVSRRPPSRTQRHLPSVVSRGCAVLPTSWRLLYDLAMIWWLRVFLAIFGHFWPFLAILKITVLGPCTVHKGDDADELCPWQQGMRTQ